MTGTVSDKLAAWNQIQRGLEFSGEQIANRLRLLALGIFYAIHILTWYGLSLGVEIIPPFENRDPQFHVQITLIVVAWVMLSLGLMLALHQRIFPRWMKYLTTGVDLLFLASILLIADGPRSASVVGFFVIVALSAIRFDLGLIRCTVAGAGIVFALLVFYARIMVGPEKDIDVTNAQALMMLAALLMEGVILGQLIRRVRHTAMYYADRIVQAEKSDA